MKKDNGEERFPLVNEAGEIVGSATRAECHGGTHWLHPVVHLHLFNPQGELYLQRRPDWKDIQPGRWDTAVGGHVDWGESIPEALLREAGEELGVKDFEPQFLGRYCFTSERESELVHVYRTTYAGIISPSNELDGGCFWSLEEIRASLGRGIFTPNFESEIVRFALV